MSASVVANIRQSLGEAVAKYSDQVIDLAHREWSCSVDYPDETLLPEWCEAYAKGKIG